MLASGCATTPLPTDTVVEKAPQKASPASRSDVAPRLVVLIVLDQFGSWVLNEHLPLLPSNSIIRRAYEDGSFHTAAFPYSSTQTAPGHASLVTGVTPAQHGIVANSIYDPKLRSRRTVDDRKHVVLGNPNRFVSPTQLRAPTVGDQLLEATDGRARVVAISMKARSAALSAGQTPTAVIFYDTVAKGLTTSTYYAPNRRLPDWLRDFNTANPVEPLLQVWNPEDPIRWEKHFGPDDRPGEMYPAFPHDPNEAGDPYYAFSSMPESSEYLIAAAYAVVKAERMGVDETPDLLVLGVSGTDIVGHIWGARSWEYADNLARIDRALTRFARLLESRGPVAFLLTADHGVADMPEQAAVDGGSGGRINGGALVDAAEAAADAALGESDWIAGYVSPLLTYTDAGKARRRDLTRALEKSLPDVEGIRAIYDATRGAELRASDADVERWIGATLPDDPPGDAYVLSEPGWFDALSAEGGTNHGTPWDYDRQVPVLMWGSAIERRTSDEVVNVLRVATSLSALLGLPPLEGAPAEPLPGVMRLPD
jgi:arylsulfatase A-like enzyme